MQKFWLKRCALVLLILVVATTGPVDAVAGLHNSMMDVSADGKLLAVVNRDNGSVSIVDCGTRAVLHEIAMGHQPENVTFIGDSHRIAVTVYADDVVVLADAESGQTTRRISVFDEPYSVVSTADGSRLYVTLEYPGQLLEIDPADGRIVRSMAAGSFPRGLALDVRTGSALICEYYTANVRRIDLSSGEETQQWEGASTDNLARQIVVHPTRAKAYVPHIRSRTSAAHGEGSIFPYVSILTMEKEARMPRKRMPMDSFIGALVTSNPWEVAFAPDGKTMVVVFSGSDDMFVCDVLDDNYRELTPAGRIRLGHNPRSACFSPDGRYCYVLNSLDFEVVCFDTRDWSESARIAVSENPLGAQVLLGKQLFYTALQPMTGRRWISCSSCHPDGDADGRTWQNPEGLRNTPPIFGLAYTHPLHWSADRDEVQDFEHTIRGQLMQGRGLIRGSVNDSLGDPNRGKSEMLDAMTAYTNSHQWTLSPHGRDGLSESAQRGRELFMSEAVGCAKCHSGPFYTDSRPENKLLTHDVGTGGDDPSELMGPKYDTPSLHGVYRTAPYLHHGKAATLKAVLRDFNRDDRHGRTSHLSDQQIDDLVEFLKALPYEDPAAQADAAGLTRIVD